VKKFILFLILIIGTFTYVYAGYVDDEASVGPLNYLADTLTFKSSASTQIDYLLTLTASRANVADGTIGGGGTLYFNVAEPLTLSLNYNYNSSKTYAVYQSVTNVTSVYQGVTYTVQSYSVPIIQIMNTFKGGISYDLPFLADYTPSIDYYLSIIPEKLLTDADLSLTGPRGHAIQVTDTLYNKNFENTVNDLSANTGLPLDFNTWLGATKDTYNNIDAQKIVDASGASLNTKKDVQALKSAIQFPRGTLYTGLSKKLSDLSLTFTYTYTGYYYSYNTSSNDFSHDFILSAVYSFAMKENLKSIDVGLKYEVLRAHYTDQTFLNSNYIYADITFNLL
jgi:hypothetical protein